MTLCSDSSLYWKNWRVSSWRRALSVILLVLVEILPSSVKAFGSSSTTIRASTTHSASPKRQYYCFASRYSSSFPPRQRSRLTPLAGTISPLDPIALVPVMFETTNSIIETVRDNTTPVASVQTSSVIQSGVSVDGSQPLQQALSSINYSNLKPAMEHTQPWFWGTPDPYLSAGKSIAPSVKALSEMGIRVDHTTGDAAAAAAVKILDQTNMMPVLPGFTPTGSLLLPHTPTSTIPLSPAALAAQMQWSTSMVNVVEHLPQAAFLYVMVEFFVLRPGIDRYTEDVEEDPARATVETLAVTGVRLVMFAIVAAITTVVFG